MASTGPLLPTRLNQECSNFKTSLIFQSVSHDSTTFSNLQPHFTSSKPKFRRKICSSNRLRRTIHLKRQELMLVEMETSLSLKSRPIAGRISHTVLCQTLTAQIHGRSFEASKAHQIPTRPMKPCPITAEQLPIPSPRPTLSSTITPGSASSTCQRRNVISIVFSKNALTLHLSTMKAALPSTCLNYCQQFRR